MKSGPKPRPPVAVIARRSAFFTRYVVTYNDPREHDQRHVTATVYEDGSPTLLQYTDRWRLVKLRESRYPIVLTIVEEAIRNVEQL